MGRRREGSVARFLGGRKKGVIEGWGVVALASALADRLQARDEGDGTRDGEEKDGHNTPTYAASSVDSRIDALHSALATFSNKPASRAGEGGTPFIDRSQLTEGRGWKNPTAPLATEEQFNECGEM